MRRLTRTTTPGGALIGESAPETAGIVHLGLGNFHRAHAAVYTARALAHEAGDWGIHGFANRSRRVVDALRAQDGRYSVLELSERGRGAAVVDVHRGLDVLAETPDAFVASVSDPARRILTLTVSEAGYCRSARTGALDADLPEVRHDLGAPERPRSTVGLIARGLAVRAADGEPFTVLSCDNLTANGAATRAVVTEFLEASGASSDVLDYVAGHVSFPDSMVDRIVPATVPETIEEVGRILGVRDEAPVPAEDFAMWVLEDSFAAGRPAWDRAGAIFSDEVEAYELVKLRLLNGSHSLIASLGALDGRETIADAWGEEFVRDAVHAVVEDDYLPTIRLPRGFDVAAYLEQLSHRWGNAPLAHGTRQVGTDGSVKLLQRVPEPALFALRRGRVPHLLALTVAGWICCVTPLQGFAPGPFADAMREPARERIAELARAATTPRESARAVLGGGLLPDALVASPAFAGRVEELVETIVRHGVRAAASDAVAASSADQREKP
ncbi:mannitol dehydrogenase family protein [Microbacterium betulae]|uniref:Mannitol-1-phosphate 5-dehydrogenase n=1 Tax=Microbacterium betulae TaxID=2981139 RepID=A0AA97I7E7_9MICO|nr:mannitol dehydrogenase family protein [Microbacterium sp. AB]WOF23355.1 mannitol dehydrogenase family protein [Microbacterium sp. AB]